jgi:eukaryotic-like serine/threonine-protein kinase
MNTSNIITNLKKLIQYIEARIVLRNLVLAFLILIFGTTIIMQILKIYTRHNDDLTVPDLSGLTLTDAIHAAQEKDMRVEVFDSVFMSDMEKGTVVIQHPEAGLKVKKNRKIFLTMNAINPEKIAMPNLVDLTFKQASAKIESFGLKLGHISYEPNIAVNLVLAQQRRGVTLNPGDSIIKGTPIDLVLGKGLSDEQSTVPNLVGLSLDQAKIAASDRYLSLGATVNDLTVVSPDDELHATIFRQKPEAGSGSMLPQGSAIDVWITLDSTKIPAVINRNDSIR